MEKRSLLRWSPLIGLLIGVVLASWLGLHITLQNQEDIDENFDLIVQRAAAQIERRMQLYEYGLRGTRGAVIAGGEERIDREAFTRYSASRDYAREFPGARGFGFIRRVPARDEAAFLRAARNDGWPGFSILQLSSHDGDRFVIQYVEPVASNLQAVGLDIASETNRRNAALRALRSGKASITDPITLVQADGKKNQGFLILLPIYRKGMSLQTEAERMAAGYGWAYAPMAIDEVLRDFDFYDNRIALRLTATEAPPALQSIYATPGMEALDNPPLRKVRHVQVFGREWQVEVQARPTLISSLNLRSPWLAFALVVLISGAGAIATYVLQTINARAERLESQAALQQVNIRYRQLIDSVKDYAIIQLDPESFITGANNGAERIHGYAASEMLGRHLSMFYPSETLPAGYLEQKLATACKDGFCHDEGWRVHKDGTRFWASVTLSPIYDDGYQLIGYSKITRDLTERRQQEEEMRQLLGLQKAILSNAGVAIIATQMDGTITLFNPSAERLLGYEADEVVGKLTPLAFHDRQEIEARAQVLSRELGFLVKPGLTTLGAKALQGQVDTHEWTYLTKTGQRKPVLLSVTAIVDENNKSLGCLGLAADLSEQKRYQAELEGAREAADRANQAKSNFLANMSHEIRTPMNAILGMTQLVLQGELQAQQRDLLGKAFGASKALLAILNDILDYSKVEAGHLHLEQREMSLESVLSNAVSLFAHQAEQKGLEIVLDIPSSLPSRLIGDPLRLAQVLSNLLSNAVKFTAQGTVTLSALVSPQSRHRYRVRFSVVDTGIGLSQQQIDQLFRPFSQADASISRKYGGTGLGLSICARLVELMGGNIEVRSTPGSGSEFYFEIDLPQISVLDATKAPVDKLHFERALVVDDQQGAAHVIQLMLHSWRVHTECVNSGREAIAQLIHAASGGMPYDLILTDWKMPEMDGVELVEHIEQLVSRGDLPHAPKIMLVSAYARDELQQRIEGHRVAALLSKPVLPSELYNVLRKLQATEPLDTIATTTGTPSAASYIAAATPLNGHHVLLVEDNEINQQVATAFLRSAGLQLSIASNGHEAVRQVQHGKFSAILMDLHMPEMDGLEATRIIRTLPGYGSLPIIAMTAAVMPQDQEACRQAGMNDFVGKPIDPDELIRVLLECLHPGHPASGWPPSTPMAVSAPMPAAWSSVENLDLADGMERLVGNSTLYAQLLHDFALSMDGLQKQLETCDIAELHPLIHKLKGTAGNLGLKAIATDCTSIENAFRRTPDVRPAELLALLLARLQTSSRQMLEAAAASTPSQTEVPGKQATHAEREHLAQLLNQLTELLRKHRMQATQHSRQVLDLLQGTTDHAAYRTVHQLIMELQFPAAIKALEALQPQLRNNGS